MIKTSAHPADVDLGMLSRRDIIVWWEARRLPYNLALGFAGIATLLLVVFAGGAAVSKGEDFVEPVMLIFGPLLWAVAANTCYTLGWAVDIYAYQGRPRKELFVAGSVVSLALTGLPGVWAAAALVFTIVTGEKL